MIKQVIVKLLSGRYFVIIAFTMTLCYLAFIEPNVRDAFFALAGGAVRDYFGRSDRKAEEPPK